MYLTPWSLKKKEEKKRNKDKFLDRHCLDSEDQDLKERNEYAHVTTLPSN